MSYKEYCIPDNLSVRDAMKKLGVVIPKVLFFVDGEKLKAVITDGDVRRYLLAGGKLDDPAITAANRAPLYAKTYKQATKLYHDRNYIAIPIIDDNHEIEDIYTGNGLTKRTLRKLDIPVIINAGGKGSRLDPYTRILPKPLIPVGEMPIIEHIMESFMDYGCDEFHVVVNYKKELIKAYFKDNERQYNISWYDEEEPLGTGGGLCYLKGKMNKTFFFSNCDILLQSNYDSMLRFHKENNNMITMICAYKNITIPYGVIKMGQNGSIEEMTEKPELSFLSNTGMYIVEPEVLDDIEDGVSIGFPDIVEMQRKKGRRVAAYPVSENEWLDMGQLSELDKMREKLYGE